MKKDLSLKDELFNREKVIYLASLFKQADPAFNEKEFTREVMKRLTELELKERIVWIAEILERYLSADFQKASAVILKALPEPLDPGKTDNDFGSFIFAPLGAFVVKHGNTKQYLPVALQTLKEITQRFSMEDAMRTFLSDHKEITLKEYKKWMKHEHYHVRRLVSESTRPLLPWSRRIPLHVQEAIEFLDVLHKDNTRFVTRSVANHLNDISKIDPDLVLQTLKRWHRQKGQQAQELAWITRHALRTLVKKGNKEAFALLGYSSRPKIVVEYFELAAVSEKMTRDGMLSFSFTLSAKEDAVLMIDYVIDFVKANGTNKPKVFKLKKLMIRKGEHISIHKDHQFSSKATTYTLYPGVHQLTLQINGNAFAQKTFTIR